MGIVQENGWNAHNDDSAIGLRIYVSLAKPNNSDKQCAHGKTDKATWAHTPGD
jgi:hypothetical protein